MIDCNPIKPCADGRFAPELPVTPKCPQKNVVRGVFRLIGITKHAQRKIVDCRDVLGINRAEPGLIPRGGLERAEFRRPICIASSHNRFHKRY